MIFYNHENFDFIPEEVGIVYQPVSSKKSIFGWILFLESGTFAGSYAVEHEHYPTTPEIQEMLGALSIELKRYKNEQGKGELKNNGSSN